jgi:hypothetical protein
MPLPLILIGIAACTALFGAGSGVNAAVKNSDAKDTNDAAKSIFDQANRKLELAKQNTTSALEDFGKQKMSTWTIQMDEFKDKFSQIRNIEFQKKFSTDGLLPISKDALGEIGTCSLNCKEILSGGVSALGAGALAGFGAYGGAAMLATASTGTAISTLSGVAATNATLAWFGGGSLAAGGLGMAGGAMVLGGLVAGPALLVGGLFMNATASKRLAEANSNYYEAKRLATEMDTAVVSLQGIQDVVKCYSTFLTKLRFKMTETNQNLQEILNTLGNDYRKYDEKTQKKVYFAAQMASLIKEILDTSLLTNTGSLMPDVGKNLEKMQNQEKMIVG